MTPLDNTDSPSVPTPPPARHLGYHAAPLWRDIVLPVLYPPPPGPSSWRTQALRVVFWLVVGAVFIAGVVLPFIEPSPYKPRVVSLDTGSTSAPALTAQAYPAGTRLRDCRDESICPWLRVVPAGKFSMGSLTSEEGHQANEEPQHEELISSTFAIMETEVMRKQFSAFAKETGKSIPTGCNTWDGKSAITNGRLNWQSPGFEQTENHPVVCVSWDDAQEYSSWLTKKTGHIYRLLTEAEWEYVARANTKTRWSFGDSEVDICRFANVQDISAKRLWKYSDPNWHFANCDDGYAFTAPVKSYKENAFGIYDLHGNVWEWVQDCWRNSYSELSNPGIAAVSDCQPNRRVLRGGGWGNYGPDGTRSAFRKNNPPTLRSNFIGFRLARTLTSRTLPERGLVESYRFEIFACADLDAASASQAQTIAQAIKKLGVPDKQVLVTKLDRAKWEGIFQPNSVTHQIRISLGEPTEAEVARLLMADAGFNGSFNWQTIPVKQTSKGYVSLVICSPKK